MKVYISLPVTGTSDYKERAGAIEKVLTEQGHTVINPVKVCENLPKDTTHKEIMNICISMLDMCDVAVFAPGWEHSTGCTLEMCRAMNNRITIGFIGELEEKWENQNRQEHTNLQKKQERKSMQETSASVFSVLRNTICRVQRGIHSKY